MKTTSSNDKFRTLSWWFRSCNMRRRVSSTESGNWKNRPHLLAPRSITQRSRLTKPPMRRVKVSWPGLWDNWEGSSRMWGGAMVSFMRRITKCTNCWQKCHKATCRLHTSATSHRSSDSTVLRTWQVSISKLSTLHHKCVTTCRSQCCVNLSTTTNSLISSRKWTLRGKGSSIMIVQWWVQCGMLNKAGIWITDWNGKVYRRRSVR